MTCSGTKVPRQIARSAYLGRGRLQTAGGAVALGGPRPTVSSHLSSLISRDLSVGSVRLPQREARQPPPGCAFAASQRAPRIRGVGGAGILRAANMQSQKKVPARYDASGQRPAKVVISTVGHDRVVLFGDLIPYCERQRDSLRHTCLHAAKRTCAVYLLYSAVYRITCIDVRTGRLAVRMQNGSVHYP